MQLTYDQEQKEQVWRALGWVTKENDGILWWGAPGIDVDDPESEPWYPAFAAHDVRSTLPKPEDVLWQLRSLAIEKDSGAFANTLMQMVNGPEHGDHYYVACATPQQIFEAALKTLEDK